MDIASIHLHKEVQLLMESRKEMSIEANDLDSIVFSLSTQQELAYLRETGLLD